MINFLLDETDILQDVNLQDVMGGISIDSYDGGCEERDHETVKSDGTTQLY